MRCAHPDNQLSGPCRNSPRTRRAAEALADRPLQIIDRDDVEGLGKFLELEVVLSPGEDEAKGEAIARDLMQQLGVEPEDLLAGALRRPARQR